MSNTNAIVQIIDIVIEPNSVPIREIHVSIGPNQHGNSERSEHVENVRKKPELHERNQKQNLQCFPHTFYVKNVAVVIMIMS